MYCDLKMTTSLLKFVSVWRAFHAEWTTILTGLSEIPIHSSRIVRLGHLDGVVVVAVDTKDRVILVDCVEVSALAVVVSREQDVGRKQAVLLVNLQRKPQSRGS